MLLKPNIGAGSQDTRKDAVRWRSVHDTNCVTRAVCRDIWADWTIRDDDSIKRLQDVVAAAGVEIRNLQARFDNLGRCLGYGGVL